MMAKTGLDRKKLVLLLIFAGMGILPFIISNEYAFQSLSMVLLYAYWATSWNIIGGFAGQEAIGHSVYIGIGGYVSVLLMNSQGVSPWIGMLVGGVIAGLVAMLISWPCFRLQGIYFTLATIALQTAVCTIMMSETHILGIQTNGAEGIRVKWIGGGLGNLQFQSKIGYYYVFFAALLLVLGVCTYIKKSKMGYYLSAICTNEEAGKALGINVTGYKLAAMFISAFFTAIGGALYAQLILFLDPSRVFGFDMAVELVVLSVVGGRGLVFGPLVGAVILVPVKEIVRSSMGNSMAGLWMVIYGLVLALAIFFMPKGIIKAAPKWWEKIRKTAGKSKKASG